MELQININIDKDLYEQYKTIADEQGYKLKYLNHQLFEHVIKQYINKNSTARNEG